MTAEQRINRAFMGWITEAVIDPSKTADFEQLKQFLIGEMEEAVAEERAEFISELRAQWEACGPWVPESDLTPEGLQIHAQFARMLSDSRIRKGE